MPAVSIDALPAEVNQFGCLYLHGFLSSPQSQKAQELRRYFERHLDAQQLSIPTLPFAPTDAIEVANSALTALQSYYPKVFLIGSSLGGFYATWLAQQHQVPAVLVNPAVRPFELFEHYLGPHTHYYSGEVHQLTTEHLDQLRRLNVDTVMHPERLLLLLQTGDETLDYRHAAQLYRESPAWLEGAGNHSFERFIERLPQIFHHISRCLKP
ncbi:YqiA/YcfP family alpha/beta fold hydrolase [Thalassolituus sp.]|jgi:predicted esterase YcpF (UPF0227 family)|uniref:YqiA/YcfP family alpha/beta fold hydrolase n=1 Tax=Thalassolituus sp. TaxID=2030822 RepID=UPI002A81DE32|nr:YqiA/YcfP family alpha/beta fold hydrolase [Thalassolituus sp.]